MREVEAGRIEVLDRAQALLLGGQEVGMSLRVEDQELAHVVGAATRANKLTAK